MAIPPLRRQFSRLAAGRAAAGGLSAIWLFVAAHLLTVPAFGDLALILSLGAVFSVLHDLGLPVVLMDLVGREPARARSGLTTVVKRRVVGALGASVIVTVGYVVASGDHSWAVPLLYSGSLVATSIYSSVTATFRGVGAVEPEAWNEVASRGAVLVAGSIWLANGGGLRAAVAVYALADIGSALALTEFARRKLPVGEGSADRSLFGVTRTYPLAAAFFFGYVYYRVDLWLLAMFRSSTVVAQYGASYRILDAVLLLAGAVSALVVPRTATLSLSERVRAGKRLTVSAVGATLPLALGSALFARPLLAVLFGRPYRTAAPVLVILVLSVLPGVVAAVQMPLLAILHRRRFVWTMASALLCNICLNLILIPRSAAKGSAWANMISQIALASAVWWQLGRISRLERQA